MKKLLIHPEELSRAWIDRMAGQGVNILGIHPVGGSEAEASARRLLEQMETPEFRVLVDYAWEKGLEVEYELHAASFLMPRALFQEHPEYFRLEEEGRTPKVNFCASNPEALEIFADNGVQLAKRLYRSRPYYYFWLDDTAQACCHCSGCRELSMSDQQMLAVNRLAEKLRVAIPGAKVCFLAYYGTAAPPKQVKPGPGVFLEYAPMNRDFAQQAFCVAQAEKDNMAALLEVFGREDATVLEYWYDNSMFSKWTKPPKPFTPRNDLIPGDVRWYEAMGFAHIASFACYLGADFEALYGPPDISAFA